MLTGQAKRDYQRHFMRRYRAEGRDPRGKTLVRPSPVSGKTLLDPHGKTQIPGLAMDGNRILGLAPAPAIESPQPYVPGRHYQLGDKVLVQQGRRTVEAVIPKLDADGNIIPDYV